jgi:glycosyltransferase involved in cell wall biosynthesis
MAGMEALTLGTVFRNAESYLERWRNLVNGLAASWDGPIHVIAVEGDSDDNTYDLLKTDPPSVAEFTLLHVEHGGPRFGSVVNPQRWKQLALACNAVLVHASLTPQTFLYIESDLVWDNRTIKALVNDLQKVPAVAPMSFHLSDPTLFYDCWGHVKDSRMFGQHPPYHPELGSTLTPVDSAGSAFAVRGHLVADLAFSPTDCIRGIGRSVRHAGHELFLDPQLAIYHP